MALELIVVTPEGQAFSGPVENVVLPGSEGDFGVLEQHERSLAPLRSGVVEITTESGTQWAAITSGFADVSSEQVVVMVDSCQTAEQVDAEAARARQGELQAELKGLTLVDEDQTRLPEIESALAHATAQLEIASK